MKEPENLSDYEFIMDDKGVVHMLLVDYENTDEHGVPKPLYTEIDAMSEDEYWKLFGSPDATNGEVVIKTHSALKREFAEKIEELKAHGISDKEMLKEITDSNKPETIYIDRNLHVYLKDQDMTEIKMHPLARILFIFYLNHPEGVAYKKLGDHFDEIHSIYQKITGREDKEAVAESIRALTDPLNSSINEKVANMRAAFRSKVPESAVSIYTPTGKKGERRVIKLDRNLVEWEKPLNIK